ncbi:dystrobrevin binding protein 1 [Phyllostomus discolor]|uniref:Dystrobrevin binding protein 1 n=1 Tax=Phyllostomus discolor TaxID=89673 RepID=A0A834AF45_9CHIR|nr:dystrobrevin binding protein 1 [Phyllostomus discolor]
MSSPGLSENSQRNASELDAEHARKVLEMEHTQQMKLRERQKFFEEAFQQDMEQYLSTGYLQIAERREPMGSMSSMEVNIDMLEQMDLMDISDQEALDCEPSHLPHTPPALTQPPRTLVKVGSPLSFSLTRRELRWTRPLPLYTPMTVTPKPGTTFSGHL